MIKARELRTILETIARSDASSVDDYVKLCIEEGLAEPPDHTDMIEPFVVEYVKGLERCNTDQPRLNICRSTIKDFWWAYGPEIIKAVMEQSS